MSVSEPSLLQALYQLPDTVEHSWDETATETSPSLYLEYSDIETDLTFTLSPPSNPILCQSPELAETEQNDFPIASIDSALTREFQRHEDQLQVSDESSQQASTSPQQYPPSNFTTVLAQPQNQVDRTNSRANQRISRGYIRDGNGLPTSSESAGMNKLNGDDSLSELQEAYDSNRTELEDTEKKRNSINGGGVRSANLSTGSMKDQNDGAYNLDGDIDTRSYADVTTPISVNQFT